MASMVAFPGMPAYCAAKGAVLMLTKTAAMEYSRQNIRVNCICPGAIRTGITDSLPEDLIQGVIDSTPLGRIADPSEVGNLALFLASPQAFMITGQDIAIDGHIEAFHIK